MRAKPSAVPPSTSTSTAEKTTPATHFTSSSRNREMGRDRIIRNVPSSTSLATRSPPTNATYNGISSRICGISMITATVNAETYSCAR